MKIVLLGYMGCGKSTIGRLFSEALQYQFIDLDQYIEQAENATITSLFSHKGEIYFRRKEAEHLKAILAEKKKVVLATGGGTPCYGTIMTDLNSQEEVVTVYLKQDIDTLTDRLFLEKGKRPMIAHLETKELLNDFIRKHLFERSFYYNQASIILPCEGSSPSEIVAKLLLNLF